MTADIEKTGFDHGFIAAKNSSERWGLEPGEDPATELFDEHAVLTGLDDSYDMREEFDKGILAGWRSYVNA